MNKLRIKVFSKRALRMSILGLVARAQQLGSAKSWHTAISTAFRQCKVLAHSLSSTLPETSKLG